MADFFDEEFGFRCKRIISNPPAVTALTPNNNFDYIQQENTTPQLDETTVGLHDTRDIFIQKAKGKFLSHGDRRQQHNSSQHVRPKKDFDFPLMPYSLVEPPRPLTYITIYTSLSWSANAQLLCFR